MRRTGAPAPASITVNAHALEVRASDTVLDAALRQGIAVQAVVAPSSQT